MFKLTSRIAAIFGGVAWINIHILISADFNVFISIIIPFVLAMGLFCLSLLNTNTSLRIPGKILLSIVGSFYILMLVHPEYRGAFFERLSDEFTPLYPLIGILGIGEILSYILQLIHQKQKANYVLGASVLLMGIRQIFGIYEGEPYFIVLGKTIIGNFGLLVILILLNPFGLIKQFLSGIFPSHSVHTS